MKHLVLKLSSKASQQMASQIKMTTHAHSPRSRRWRAKIPLGLRCLPLVYALLLVAICSSVCLVHRAAASETESSPEAGTASKVANSIPSNHRAKHPDDQPSNSSNNAGPKTPSTPASSGRQSRQYDGPVSASSSSGSYSAIGVGSDGAYVSQASSNPLFGSGGTSSGAYGTSDLTGSYHNPSAYHHVDPMLMARGYSPQAAYYGAGAGFPSGSMSGAALSSPSSPLFSGGGPFAGSSLMTAKGFDVAEIVCTAIAVAIGAVIVGAPFILIYLFFMNHMNAGPGGAGMGSNGGPITLTGPNTSNQSGRKKRHTSLPEALFKQLSPLVNSEQVANTFKVLMSSISKYQM